MVTEASGSRTSAAVSDVREGGEQVHTWAGGLSSRADRLKAVNGQFTTRGAPLRQQAQGGGARETAAARSNAEGMA